MTRLGFNSKLREGDTVLVWKLDGIARSISHFLKLIGELDKRGVSFKRMKSWAGAKLKTSHRSKLLRIQMKMLLMLPLHLLATFIF